ncbi:hypothetical protein V1522DRAFT_335377, partial [Lipomyces starkeyi]
MNDDGKESVKTPDGGLEYSRPGLEAVAVVAIEVGVSETYEKLFADITRWMQEFHCHTGILFSLNETPRFSYPGRQVMNAYSAAIDLDPFSVTIGEARLNQPFGYYLNWFGTLDSAFIEIYRRDPISASYEANNFRSQLLRVGIELLQGDNIDVGLAMEDLFPPGQEDIEEIRQVPISLDVNLLQKFLEDGTANTAKFRFQHAL